MVAPPAGSMGPAPLAGRRVLDLGACCAQVPHGLAASMAARLCAAYGAEVVRPVPAGGDPFAHHAPLLPGGGSALDRFLNTGKRIGAAAGHFDAAIGDTAALAGVAAQVKVRISHFRPGEDPVMGELGLLALSGLLGIVGDSEGPPARLAGHQAAYAGGLAAHTALLAALRASGEEVVEISLFDVCCWLNWKVAASVVVLGTSPMRGGNRADWYTTPCKDGHIALVYQEKDWPAVQAMVGDPRLDSPAFQDRPGRRSNRAALLDILGPWFMARTRAEITAAAQSRRIPIGPVLFPAELLADRQHTARGFIAADGMPVLPLSWNGARVLPQSGAKPAPPAATPREKPLSGIKVVDLGWLTAGAASAAVLLDLGAEVIKVEGPSAPDPFRNNENSAPGEPWWNQSAWFAFTNRGKQSLCLDLKDARGRDVLLRLLEDADVLVENYRRGVLANFELSPDYLRQRFPRLVVASISSQGETGPERDMTSFGSTLEATGGLAALTGSGVAPVISGRDVNYPDQVVCLFASGAMVAALLERDRTGQGAHLDLSQRELTSFLLGEELLAAAAGAPSPRRGNADPLAPADRVVPAGEGWRAEWAGGSAPVRDGYALAEAPEFRAGTAVLRAPDGKPAKGIPFRFTCRPLAVTDSCHALGADNRAVLAAHGFAATEIAALEAAGVLATEPRSKRHA